MRRPVSSAAASVEGRGVEVKERGRKCARRLAYETHEGRCHEAEGRTIPRADEASTVFDVHPPGEGRSAGDGHGEAIMGERGRRGHEIGGE